MEATIFTLVRATASRVGFEVWMGDPAEIKAKRVKKQKLTARMLDSYAG